MVTDSYYINQIKVNGHLTEHFPSCVGFTLHNNSLISAQPDRCRPSGTKWAQQLIQSISRGWQLMLHLGYPMTSQQKELHVRISVCSLKQKKGTMTLVLLGWMVKQRLDLCLSVGIKQYFHFYKGKGCEDDDDDYLETIVLLCINLTLNANVVVSWLWQGGCCFKLWFLFYVTCNSTK